MPDPASSRSGLVDLVQTIVEVYSSPAGDRYGNVRRFQTNAAVESTVMRGLGIVVNEIMPD
jgi:hypothetical protein